MTLHRNTLMLALLAVAGVSGCSEPEVPLATNPAAEAAKPADYPRESLSSLPIQPTEAAGGSICSIESVKGATFTEVQADGSIVIDLPASVSGWAFPPADLAKPSDAWLRLMPHDKTVAVRELPLSIHIARPDVSNDYGPAAAFSGYGDVTLADLPAGSYDAQIVFVTANGRATCDNARGLIVR